MAKETIEKEIEKLAKTLSGERKLRKEQVLLEKKKKEALRKRKEVARKKIVRGEIRLEEDEEAPKKVVQKITLYEWEAPIRFRYPIEIKTFLIIVAICLVFIVYFAVLGHYGLMASLIALLFFIYVAGTTAPMKVKHKVTARGIETMEVLYEWFMLDSFWFTKRGEEYLLSIDTKLRIPARLLLLIKKEDLGSIFVLLEDKLLYKDIRKQGWVDIKSYGEYIKLEEVK